MWAKAKCPIEKTMTVKCEPFVSIVSPVYNGECYLRECIESVLAQTHTHWDYTIVNNCSTDRTLKSRRSTPLETRAYVFTLMKVLFE